MNIILPNEVVRIINDLESKGHEAYAVGGCVRDSILNIEPKDWDITTSATPDEIKDIFPVTIDTGIEHGTVTVRLNKKSFEVTTYRSDGEYLDKRHPKKVSFVSDLKEDLRRRDFTINAMAYNDRTGLVDVFGGIDDIKAGIIRCVEDPLDRFDEDALRMLRALRFSAQLGFAIEPSTEHAIESLAENIKHVSQERITVELVKLICSDNPGVMKDVSRLGLSRFFLPEWDAMLCTEQNTRHHIANVGEHSVLVMERVSPTKHMRLAALLHDVAKPLCKKTDIHGVDHFVGHPQIGYELSRNVMKRLKLDNGTIQLVSNLVRFHDERPPVRKHVVRRCMNRMGQDVFPDIFELRRADVCSQSDYMRAEKLELIDGFEELYHIIKQEEDAIFIKDLKINGKDIISLGVCHGPKIGHILAKLLEDVLVCPEHNERDYLIAEAKRYINEI